MNDHALFFAKFLTQIPRGNTIASLAPSSRWLARTTVRGVDWGRAQTLLELGAGTGPITRAIAERVRPGCRVIVVERDPDFARLLRERFGTLADFEIIEGDVRDLGSILADRGVGRVDHILSGLPIPSFPPDLRQALFGTVREILRPGGTFHQITEIPWVYWPFYRRYFEQVSFAFEPRNLPPSGAYVCRGPREIP